MTTVQRSCFSKNAINSLRRTLRLSSTFPVSFTPWIWKTDLAVSRPIMLRLMAGGSLLAGSDNPQCGTSMPLGPSTPSTVAYRPCTALTHYILWLSSALSAKCAVLIHYATVVLALQLHIAHVRLSRTTFCGYLRHFLLNVPS